VKGEGEPEQVRRTTSRKWAGLVRPNKSKPVRKGLTGGPRGILVITLKLIKLIQSEQNTVKIK
jgi:hypothetical protein